jgi:hypothetical protein
MISQRSHRSHELCLHLCSSGGQCYRLCDGRTIISNITSVGGLGSYHGSGADNRTQIYCLWILTAFSSLENHKFVSEPSTLSTPNITLTVLTDLVEFCSQVKLAIAYNCCSCENFLCVKSLQFYSYTLTVPLPPFNVYSQISA